MVLYNHKEDGKQECTAKVNWSAMGPTNPEETKEYAELLIKAAKVAEQFNNGEI